MEKQSIGRRMLKFFKRRWLNFLDNKEKNKDRIIQRSVKALDVVLVVIPFAVAWFTYYHLNIYSDAFFLRGHVFVIVLYTFVYYLLAHLYKGFALHINRISDLIFSQALAAGINNFVAFMWLWLLIRYMPNVPVLILVYLAQLVLIFLWCLLAHIWYFKTFAAKKTVVIWDELKGIEDLVHEYGMENHFDIYKVLNVNECIETGIDETLEGAQVVFLCSLHSHERNQIIKRCVDLGVTSIVLPRIGDVIMTGAERIHLFHLPMMQVGRYNPVPEYLVAKRIIDFVLSTLLLIILSPLMLITALIIKLSDGGSVFYKQIRLTKDGKLFYILKFRSMRMDAEKDGVARLSSGEEDPRITPFGRFIRKCRIDEIPQLINIFKGDMSFVGPRPERPEIAKQYEKELPEFNLRLQVKCGLTGYAQVYGKYNTTPYDKLLLDLMYIAHPSLSEDFKILFSTVRILFSRESTEGVDATQVTAQTFKRESCDEEESDKEK